MFCLIERSADPKLTKQIQEIEDALGNEVYFFTYADERKNMNYQDDSSGENM